jgi:hypothetical protein
MINRCTRGTFFTALTLVTIGALPALFVLALVVLVEFRLLALSATIRTSVIVGLVASTLLFIFALCVSWSQRPLLYRILTVIILLIPSGIVALAVWALASKEAMLGVISSLWDSQAEDKRVLMEALEDSFHCCGWTSLRPNCTAGEATCGERIGSSFRSYADGVAGGVLAFALVLFAGAVVACWMSGKAPEESEDLESRLSGLTQPMVFGGQQETGNRGGSEYYW